MRIRAVGLGFPRIRAVGLGFPRSSQRKLLRAASETAQSLNPWPLKQHPCSPRTWRLHAPGEASQRGWRTYFDLGPRKEKRKTDDLKPQPGGDLA